MQDIIFLWGDKMLIQELVLELRNVIGDNNLDEPNITDDELKTILKNSAAVYSRIKNIVKVIEIPYDKTEEYYDLPVDCYKTKKVLLKELGIYLNFTDNLTQIILENLPDVDSGTLKITYSRYFSPEEIDEREHDLYFLYCEALCYKLMASKTAELIKFSTGEKIVDESLISEKYLKLFKETEKNFKKKIVKAYGKRANNMLENLDYDLPGPPIGEQP
jgi:hypothetical protein